MRLLTILVVTIALISWMDARLPHTNEANDSFNLLPSESNSNEASQNEDLQTEIHESKIEVLK